MSTSTPSARPVSNPAAAFSGSNIPGPRPDSLIANPASELNFAGQDLPEGWQITIIDNGAPSRAGFQKGDGHEVRAEKYGTKFTETLDLFHASVWVFPTLESATKSYREKHKDRAGRSGRFYLYEANFGSESFIFATKGYLQNEVYFRISNVIGYVSTNRKEWPNNQRYSENSPKKAKQWAGKLESKIDRVKRFGQAPPP